MTRTLLPGLLGPLLVASTLHAQAADVVYVNGRLWTGDPAQPAATAMAVQHDRLVRVGSDSAVRALATASTRVVDLAGHRIVPGFIDSHWHFSSNAAVDLTDAGSPDSIVARLRRAAQRLPAGQWLRGRGWTPSDFPGNAAHKRYLDAAFPNRPVYLTDRDGHQALVNSEAMRRAKVTAATADPPRGVIEREAGGVPTGLLKEGATALVSRSISPPTRAEIAQRIDDETRKAAALGLTFVQEASPREPTDVVVSLLQEAAAADTLRLRWRQALPFKPTVTDAELRRYRALSDSTRGSLLRFGIAKGMLDGTVDAKTAAMLEPYAGTDATGLPFWPAATVNGTVARYDRAGLQVELHAIGDKAIRMALDAYAAAATRNQTTGRRHRVEHIEVPDPRDVPRFKPLGVIASTQAIFATPDVTTLTNYAPLLGPTRAARSNNFRQFDDAGAVQAFGSDYPVFPMDPLLGVYTAATRMTPQGTPAGGWYPAGRITVEAALRHYTRDAAYAAFRETELGVLKAGMLADFVELTEDILTVPATQLLTARVQRTVVGGREVYLAPASRP
jgi:predicted amidohydrolase YtcJ